MYLNWPNRITLARIGLIVPLVYCLVHLQDGGSAWRHVAMIIFLLMGISDALDGYVARRLNCETTLGRVLDPLGDKLLIIASFIVLSMESHAVPDFLIPMWVCLTVVVKDAVTVIGCVMIYAVTKRWQIQPSRIGKACTGMQVVVIGFVLCAPDLLDVIQRSFAILCWMVAVITAAAALDYVRAGIRFGLAHRLS
jgi:cardiolipin synthase